MLTRNSSVAASSQGLFGKRNRRRGRQRYVHSSLRSRGELVRGGGFGGCTVNGFEGLSEPGSYGLSVRQRKRKKEDDDRGGERLHGWFWSPASIVREVSGFVKGVAFEQMRRSGRSA